MSVVRPHRMVDLGATRPFGLALIDWRVIGDLVPFVYMKGRAAIAAATEARWLNMEGYARLCINACIGNTLISHER